MITNKDMGEIIDLLTAAYGDKAFPVDDPKKMAKVVNLWSVMYQDDSPEEVLISVKDCIATLQFAPRFPFPLTFKIGLNDSICLKKSLTFLSLKEIV